MSGIIEANDFGACHPLFMSLDGEDWNVWLYIHTHSEYLCESSLGGQPGVAVHENAPVCTQTLVNCTQKGWINHLHVMDCCLQCTSWTNLPIRMQPAELLPMSLHKFTPLS